MIYLRKKINDFLPEDYEKIINFLKQGKVLVLPTDTIYGFSALASNQEAVDRIFSIKKREENKPFITLISSLEMAQRYAVIKDDKIIDVKKIWQDERPTTIIFPAKNNLANGVLSKEGKISMRLPKSDFLIKILNIINEPIVSTSFNLSGEDYINSLDNLESIFKEGGRPDLVVDIGPTKTTKPSKLVDLTGGIINIIRD